MPADEGRTGGARVVQLGELIMILDLHRQRLALQAAMQRRAGQVREGGLERVEAVVGRQERVTAKGDDDRLVLR